MRSRRYRGSMRDSEVVAAIVAGDPEGLAAAYDKYAAPLYNYCRTLLREPADAADAVQDTFVIAASKLSALRDQERLRSWLYAVARNECHRRLRGGSAHAPLEEAPEVTDDSADVSVDAERRELSALINAALGGVGPAEREVLELQLRQGLDGGEVAAVLGLSRNHAHALLSRARDQLQMSLGVLLVARSGRSECAELDALLGDWDGQLTVLLRKRLNRHIERCPICSGRRRRELAPAMFLGLAPILALPAISATLPDGLRETVLRAAGSASPHAGAAAGAASAGAASAGGAASTGSADGAASTGSAGGAASTGGRMALGRGGFPKPVSRPPHAWRHSRSLQAGTAVACAAGLAVAGAVIASHGPTQHGAAGGGVSPSVTSSGSQVPGTSRTPGASRTSRTSRTSGTPGATASAAADVTHGPGQPQPGSSSSSGAGAAPGSSSAPAAGSSSSSAAPSSSASSAPPAAGTLTVTPTSILLTPLLGGSLTLTATGGPVKWSISEPASLLGALRLSQSSGTLASGTSQTITMSVFGLASLDTTLTINPGNISVTVVLGLG
jgi:RNA polymerase sigma factor (sigma-70 family)